MPLRSVYDLEIGPGWQQHLKEFADYEERVKRLPKEWQKIVGVVGGRGGGGREAAAGGGLALGRELRLWANGEDSRVFRTSMKEVNRLLFNTAQNARTLAERLHHATGDLVKWSTIIGAGATLLGGAGGLWGLDRLAVNAAVNRRGAQGLGVTTAEQTAFGINYGRLAGGGLLSSVAEAQNDLANWQFAALGINPRGKDAAQLAQEVVRRAHDLWQHGDRSLQTMHAKGLDRFLSMEDWRRIGNTSDAELGQIANQFAGDRRNLFVKDADLKAWQEFRRQMQSAGAQIETTFIRGLEPVTGGLTALSKAVADEIAALLSKPELKQWLTKLNDGLEYAAKYIGSDRFTKDVDNFVGGIERMSEGVWSFLRRFHLVSSAGESTLGGAKSGGAKSGGAKSTIPGNSMGSRGMFGWDEIPAMEQGWNFVHPENATAQDIVSFYEKMGWTHAQAAGLAANAVAESGLNPNATGDKGQAYGIFQWHPDRQALFAKLFGHDIHGSTLQEQLKFHQWELENSERLSGRMLHMAKTAREAAGIESTYDLRPADKAGQAAYRGNIAAGIAASTKITIENNTGGSAIVSSSQLVQ